MAKRAAKKDDTLDPCMGPSHDDAPSAAASSPATPDGTRCMVTLPAAELRLLDTACLVDGLDRSDVVTRLIREGLGGYYSGRKDRASVAPE